MPETSIADLARKHGLSEDAVRTLVVALERGGGRQAQFDHPDLGGFGQWSGGMVQIGDMFNDALKAKVAALCTELAGQAHPPAGAKPSAGGTGSAPQAKEPDAWWPPELGRPSSVGSQDGGRYAFFPETRRLAVVADGHVTVYDTGDTVITGVSQSQSTGSHLAFTSRSGPVTLDSLRVIGSRDVGA